MNYPSEKKFIQSLSPEIQKKIHKELKARIDVYRNKNENLTEQMLCIFCQK